MRKKGSNETNAENTSLNILILVDVGHGLREMSANSNLSNNNYTIHCTLHLRKKEYQKKYIIYGKYII